ncbi:MAG: hypothetical protein EOP53_00680 [Sphingobacteriales bacterium]|nr:MAG: hypothetical protein EOP53_00680 [Sphingobacteriales bacterium]
MFLGGLFVSQQAKATHLMGGDLTYKNIGNNQVELTFLVYRDCNGNNAGFDASIGFRVYDASAVANSDYTKFKSYNVTLKSSKKVSPEIPNCKIPSGVCIEQGTYIKVITLGNDSVGFHVSYFRNERNNSAITNLAYGAANCAFGKKEPFGSVWYTYIPRKAIKNSSPQFLTKPIPYLCAGKKNVFNPLASDPDRDSMVFSLATPYSPAPSCPINAIDTPYPPGHKNFSKVTYKSGYSVTNPFGGTSSISINSVTGEITASPTSAGNYVIAIQVKEYRVNPVTRKTEYVGEIRRDLQFIVGTTCPSVAAPVFTKDTLGLTRYVYPDDTVCFNITGSAGTKGDTLYLSGAGGVFKGTNSTISSPYAKFDGDTAKNKVTSDFCWTPSCAQITYTSPFIVTFNLADNNCNSVYRTYSIYVRTRDIIKPPLMQCINIQDDSTIKLTFYDSVTSKHFKQYKIYKREGLKGSFQLVDSINTQKKATLRTWTDKKAKNFGSTVYSYYITSQNTCGLEGLESDTISTIVVDLKKISDKAASATWNSHRSKKVWYRIYVDGGSGFKLTDSTQNLSAIYSYCEKSFRIRIEVADTHCVSNSLPTSQVSLKDATAPFISQNALNVTVLNHTTTQLTFTKSDSADVKYYYIYRAANGGSYSLVDSVKHVKGTSIYNYKNTGLNTTTNIYCYKIKAKDTCGNMASGFSNEHCTVKLTGTNGQYEAFLGWNRYAGYVADTVEIQQYISGKWKALKFAGLTDSTHRETNLKCGVNYYYRIVYRSNTSGYFSVSDSVKITPFDTIPPGEVNIKSASATQPTFSTPQYINITYLLNKEPDITKYEIYYSTNGGAFSLLTTNYTTTSSSGESTITVKTLRPDKNNYCFRVYAVDSCGKTQNKSRTSETHCLSQLTGKQLNNAVFFNWTKYKGFGIQKYVIAQRGTFNASSSSFLGIDSTTDTFFTIKNLPCNVPQSFIIITTSTDKPRLTTLSDTIILTPFDTIRPAEVNIRNVTVKTDTSISITFDKVPDKDVKKYDIYYKEDNGSYSKLTTVSLPFTSPYTYTHTGINALTKTYSYQVYAVDSCADNTSLTSETHTAIQLEGEGRNLSNYLSWNTYKGFKVKNYTVQKLNGKTWKNLAVVGTKTTYLDSGLACNVPQYYRIQTFEDGGDAAVSFSDTIALTPYDTIKPPQTVIHFVTVKDNETIQLSWAKSLAKDVKAYKLTRTNNFSGDVYMDTIKLDTFYTDKNVDATLGSYHYVIQAMDSCADNLSPESATFSSVYLYDSIFGCEQKIHVKWIVPNTWKTDIKEFEIYRTAEGGTEKLLTKVAGNKRSYTDLAITNQQQYKYRVKAIQLNGNAYSAYSNTDSIQTFIPEKPEILYASKLTTDETNGQTEIRWKSQLSSVHIQYHDVYARENGSGSYMLIAGKIPSSQDSFIHVANTKTSKYEYIVISTDSCGTKADTAKAHTTIDMNMTVGQLIHDLVWTPYKGFDVDHYKIEQFLGGEWQYVDNASGTDTALIRFPVPCNTTVFYRVIAVSFDDVEAVSDSASGQALDTIPANAPILNNATVLNGNTIQINFRGADSLDVFGYAIVRSTDGQEFEGVDFLPINTFGENLTYFDNINAEDNQFCYTVLTLDSCLNFTASDTFCTIQLKGEALNQANQLNWHPFKGYNIDYDLEKWNGTSWQTIQSFTLKDTALLIKPLACSVAQTYRITGREISGTRITRSDTITLTPFDTIIPDEPILHFATVKPGGMEISWSWNKQSDVKYFEVWRKDSVQPVFKKIATVKYDSVYLDKSISEQNHIWSYQVKAIDSCDASHVSAASATHQTMKIRGATLACVPLVWLNWTAYKDLENGTDNYRIYRAENGGSFSLLRTVNASTLFVTDSTVTEGKNYCYRIEAFDVESGFTALSDSICIVPKVYPLPLAVAIKRATVTQTGTINGEILLEWEPITDADIYASGYKIYVSENGGAYTLLKTIADRNTVSFNHTTINTRNNTFSYTVYPYNVCDKNALSSFAHKAINLNVSNQNLQAVLQWNSYEGFTVDHYEIEKSINGSPLKTAYNIPSTQTIFSDTNIYCGKIYTYRITAFEKGGNSLISLSDTVTVIAFDTIPPQRSDISVASVISTSYTLGQIRIDFTSSKDKNRFAYAIFRSVNNGVYQPLDTLVYAFFNPLQYVDGRLNTKENTYSYYVVSLDSCGNSAMPSDTHRAVLLDVTAMSAYNQLTWTPYIGFVKNASGNPYYVVEKFYDNGLGWNKIATLVNGETQLVDSNIHCNVLYTYRILTFDGLGQQSFSNTDTARAFEHILPIVPDIKLVTVTQTHHLKGKAKLSWKPSISTDVAKYLVYRKSNNNNWSLIATLPNTDTVFNDVNLNTYRISYEYKVLAIDTCMNLSLDNGEIHQTVNLKATAQDSKIQLDWNAYDGFGIKEYRLYRNGKLVQVFANNIFGFTDTFVKCKNAYNYSLQAISDTDTMLISYSNTDSLQPFDTKPPVPVYLISASVSKANNQAEILWTKSLSFDVAGYILYRKNIVTNKNDLVYTTKDPLDTFYKDNIQLTDGRYCYFVLAYDDCENKSAPSNHGCLIYMSGIVGNDVNDLGWNAYETWAKGVDYYNIYRRDDNGLQTKIGTVQAGNRNLLDKELNLLSKDFCYQVEAVEILGGFNARSFSTELCLQQKPHIYIPNAFTPGTSLNLNDDFGPKGAYFQRYEMKIFNRWGERIYETNQAKGWNGKAANGEVLPEGVYMYKITVYGYDGTPYLRDGLLYLLW